MGTLRRVLGLAIVGLTVIALVAAEPASADTGGDEMDFVARINSLRASKGVAPLAVQGDLFDVARAWSARMSANNALAHNPSLGSQMPAGWTRIAENVGTASDVAGMFDAFVNSPVHYNNMVDPNFESLGVGVVQSASGQLYATMAFMTGGSSAPASAASASAAPRMVRKVVRVCSKNRRGRTVCVRRARLVAA